MLIMQEYNHVLGFTPFNIIHLLLITKKRNKLTGSLGHVVLLVMMCQDKQDPAGVTAPNWEGT